MSTHPQTDPRLEAFAGSHLLLLDPDLEPSDVVGLLRNLRPALGAGDHLAGEGGARSYRRSPSTRTWPACWHFRRT